MLVWMNAPYQQGALLASFQNRFGFVLCSWGVHSLLPCLKFNSMSKHVLQRNTSIQFPTLINKVLTLNNWTSCGFLHKFYWQVARSGTKETVLIIQTPSEKDLCWSYNNKYWVIRTERLTPSLTHWCCAVVRSKLGCQLGWLQPAGEPARGRDYHLLPGGSGTALTSWWTGTCWTTGKQKQIPTPCQQGCDIVSCVIIPD